MTTKTTAAVKERLTKEINYWDHRANELKAQELAGRPNAKINSAKARQRADELEARLAEKAAGIGGGKAVVRRVAGGRRGGTWWCR